jgi:hypothetical protein
MRFRWCVPAAAVAAGALVTGSVLVAGATASASVPVPASGGGPVLVRPGGPAGGFSSAGPWSPGKEVRIPNWSGYAASGGTGAFRSVSASWTQPTGTCGSRDQYASFWVGLDGYTSMTVEQTGTQLHCYGGRAHYSAWWEMFPADPHYFATAVKPGDKLSASVTYAGGSSYTLRISDRTQGWSHALTKSIASAKRSSAEVIVEAPSGPGPGGLEPLADFGTVSFTSATVDGSRIGRASPVEIIMAAGSVRKDKVSALTDGENFTATWLHS